MQTNIRPPRPLRKRRRARSPARSERAPPPQRRPALSPRAPAACLTGQATTRRSRSEPSSTPLPARIASPDPAPSSSQVLPPRRDSIPVCVPPKAEPDVPCDEAGLQRALTRGTIISLNVGPVGLASSLPALAPILAVRPVAVLLQEAHVPASQLQSMRALIHKHFPAYCLFASRKARSGGKIDIVTLVHIKMAARASLLDISKEFAPLAEQAPEALSLIHI
jgi:hypothetical protein